MADLLFPRTILIDGEPVRDPAYVDLPTTKTVDGRDVLLTGDEQVVLMGLVAWKRCVGGIGGVSDVQLSLAEQVAFHADWAANWIKTEKNRLAREAEARLKATDQERQDLLVAATLDPVRKPELQALEDYRVALKAMPATIVADLDAIGVKPWPEKPAYEPVWPVKS